MQSRFTEDEMRSLSRVCVARIDLYGQRGITLCSMDEIEAMAMLLVVSGALQEPDAAAQNTPLNPPSNEE